MQQARVSLQDVSIVQAASFSLDDSGDVGGSDLRQGEAEQEGGHARPVGHGSELHVCLLSRDRLCCVDAFLPECPQLTCRRVRRLLYVVGFPGLRLCRGEAIHISSVGFIDLGTKTLPTTERQQLFGVSPAFIPSDGPVLGETSLKFPS